MLSLQELLLLGEECLQNIVGGVLSQVFVCAAAAAAAAAHPLLFQRRMGQRGFARMFHQVSLVAVQMRRRSHLLHLPEPLFHGHPMNLNRFFDYFVGIFPRHTMEAHLAHS
jgi:hypothetical protein